MEKIEFNPGDSQEYDETEYMFSPPVDGRYLVNGDPLEFENGLPVRHDVTINISDVKLDRKEQ